jgi:hypothetical protein
MKGHTLAVATTALAAATVIFITTAQAENPSPPTNPGFVPNTGQINPGHAAQPWSAAPPLPQDQQPAQEDARAALMMPDDGAPSAGQGAAPAQNSGDQATTGAVPGSAPTAAGAGTAGPIGATIQTMPAKFSRRNDLLDHMPMMAWPLRLSEQQRQQIYQAVMADKSAPAAGAEALKPASALAFEQLQDMHPLPQGIAGIDGLQGLKYVKGKDKVLLVRPSTGIVVDQLTM